MSSFNFSCSVQELKIFSDFMKCMLISLYLALKYWCTGEYLEAVEIKLQN